MNRKQIESKIKNLFGLRKNLSSAQVWIILAIFIFALFGFLWILRLSLVYLKDYYKFIFIKNFGFNDMKEIFSFFIVSLSISFILYCLLNIILILLKKKLSKIGLLSIFLGLFIFIFGFFVISSIIFDDSRPEFNVWDGSSVVGQIKCYSQSEKFIVGEIVYCNASLYGNFNSIYGSLTFRYTNGSENTISIIKENVPYYFNIPGDVESLFFSIGASESSSIGSPVRIITSTAKYHFLTDENFKKNQEKFLTYMLGLLTIIFVTVPIVIINLRNLFGKSK